MKGKNGKFMTRQIFLEMSDADKREEYPPVFTLKMEEYKGLPSAYEVYMSSVDEYDAAIKITGSMKNWRLLCSAAWFMEGAPEIGHEGLVQWRKDMQERDRSIAKRQLAEAAAAGNVTAMKTLYTSKTIKGKTPTKSQVKREDSKVVNLTNRMSKVD